MSVYTTAQQLSFFKNGSNRVVTSINLSHDGDKITIRFSSDNHLEEKYFKLFRAAHGLLEQCQHGLSGEIKKLSPEDYNVAWDLDQLLHKEHV